MYMTAAVCIHNNINLINVDGGIYIYIQRDSDEYLGVFNIVLAGFLISVVTDQRELQGSYLEELSYLLAFS